MNITITGNLGSGKSSIGKILKEKGYEIVSTGNIFRSLAMEKGLSVEEFNKQVNEATKNGDRSVDKMIDDTTAKIGREKDHIMFDSRLAWNFVPDSFKVFVITDINEAARRVFNDSARSNSESYESLDACKKALIHRQEMETVRYKDIYNIDYYDMSNYNLVIESTNASPSEIAEEILAKLSAFENKSFSKLMELNPSSIHMAKNTSDDGEIIVKDVNGNWFLKSGKNELLNKIAQGIKFVEVKVDSEFNPELNDEDSFVLNEKGFMNFSKMN